MALVQWNRNPSAMQLRVFGLALAVVCAIVTVTARNPAVRAIALILGAAVAAASGLAPRVLRPVYLALTLITLPIGYAVSFVALGLVYFLVVTPIGVGLRLMGRDPLKRRFEPAALTYWEPRRLTREEPTRPGLVRELWDFVRQNKKWWLVPILIALLLLAVLVALGGSGLSPFLYPLF